MKSTLLKMPIQFRFHEYFFLHLISELLLKWICSMSLNSGGFVFIYAFAKASLNKIIFVDLPFVDAFLPISLACILLVSLSIRHSV